MSKLKYYYILTLLISFAALGQTPKTNNRPWSERIAKSLLALYPDSIVYPAETKSRKWNYEQGLIAEALHQYWLHRRDSASIVYIQKNLDYYIATGGSIRTYKLEDFNIDNVAPGKALLRMYELTKTAKYKHAADTLREQLRRHPRVQAGGFWHKKIYPYQMWLDGIYMGQPFYTYYASLFNEPAAFDDIALHITLLEQHARDPKTGLLYHAWDESKQQRWANPETGCSPHFWGRAMGWYAMALVDVLDYFPEHHPKRKDIIAILQRLAEAVAKYQDASSGLWYQVVDQGNREGNYLEASASSMFTYALAKGVRKGYIDKKFVNTARKGFDGILKQLTTVDEKEVLSLHHVCSVAGLGGDPYRNGSFEYYVNEPQRTNDLKGYGPFLLAAIELERQHKGEGRSAK